MKVCPKDPADSVTAMVVSAGVDESALRKTMRAKFGYQIAGGQGDLTGKIIRFSHMGYVDMFDTMGVLAALEMTLAAQGHKFAMGSGVSAAQKVFAESVK